ncbi:MAG TPA: YkgJ family cysteine cluster protein [Pirellulaceae bacterium]|nr:YkgJ family cysteine cluster protein [Pirellulaceae bacterium]
MSSSAPLAPPRLKPRREDLPADANLCEYCTAKCCRYFALPMDTPETFREFEFVRWFLLHDRATVFVEDDIWYLLVHTTCKHLRADHRCGIYETRPQICREYTTEACEYEDRWTYERYFETAEQVHEFALAMFSDPDSPDFRTPPPAPLPILS